MGKKSKKQRRRERKRAKENQQANQQPNSLAPPPNLVDPNAGRVADSDGGANGPAKQNSGKSEGWANWYLIVQTFVGIALVAFTFGQVIVGYWQWDATNKQWEVMVLEQRPWLEISRPTLVEFAAEKQLKATFEVNNVGHTPGTIISADIGLGVVPPRAEVDKLAREHRQKSMSQPDDRQSVIPPGTGKQFDAIGAPIMDEASLKEIEAGTLTFLVIVRLVYLDVFGERHNTWGCYVYSAENKILQAHDKYNYMD
ncbi:MAG: hypothetical protein WD063_09805 [Pirellulales bacterium]